jgi:hypothetical protein
VFALVAQGCMHRLGAGARAVAGPDSVTVQLYVLQRTLCVLSKCCAQAPWPTGTTTQWYDDNTMKNCRYEVSTHRVDFLDHGAFFWTAARQRRPHLHNFHLASTTTAMCIGYCIVHCLFVVELLPMTFEAVVLHPCHAIVHE